MRIKLAIIFGLCCLCADTANAQKVIRLYEGAAPSSENWAQRDAETELADRPVDRALRRLVADAGPLEEIAALIDMHAGVRPIREAKD